MGHDNMAHKFSRHVLDLLQKAGWFEGRNISLVTFSPTQLGLFTQAQEVLREYGGLHVGECGPGIDCATSDVHIDPSLTVHLEPELKDYEKKLGTRLFPLGEVHRGHGYIVIDEQGKTYLLSDELVGHQV